MAQNVHVVRDSGVFNYDPYIQGYDTNYWKTVSGTPTAASNKIRLNAAETESIQGIKNGELEMLLTIPAAPTAGDSRSFGFKASGLGNLSRAQFNISGTAFTAVVYDADGTSLLSYTITWSSAWTNTATRFSIVQMERAFYFKINGAIKAKLEDSSSVARKALPISIANGNADNMDVSMVSVF